MKYNRDIHHRRSIRLKGYDYTQGGAYFVTICTQNRDCIFGEIAEGKMVVNAAGDMVQTVWNEIPMHYTEIDIDAFVVMPNHVHGIIAIVGATPCGCPNARAGTGPGQAQGPAPTVNVNAATLSLGDMVHRFKTMTTKRYVDGVKQLGWRKFSGRLWQRNYWEHIVRHEEELNRIREYIYTNPTQWKSDALNLHVDKKVGEHLVREPFCQYSNERWMV